MKSLCVKAVKMCQHQFSSLSLGEQEKDYFIFSFFLIYNASAVRGGSLLVIACFGV